MHSLFGASLPLLASLRSTTPRLDPSNFKSTPTKLPPILVPSCSPASFPSSVHLHSADASTLSAMNASDADVASLGNFESDGNLERKPAKRIAIENNHGEKMIGILQESDSEDLVILCHGFRSSKESRTIATVSDALVAGGISIFRFDFSGNGESEGSFQYGNYLKEVDDLRAVILHFLQLDYRIKAIAGHSKGGNVVLLYASLYRDIAKVINISGRFEMNRGIDSRLGKDFLQKMKEHGYIDVKNRKGEFDYRVTEESLMERLNTNMHDACRLIDKSCMVLTIHGSEDGIVPVGDAFEFAKQISNHKLCIIDGADHKYSCHPAELASVLLEFLSDY